MERRLFLTAVGAIAASAAIPSQAKTPLTIEGQPGELYVVPKNSQYIFVFPKQGIDQKTVDRIHKLLEEKGFVNPLVFGGPTCEGMGIFEIHNESGTSDTSKDNQRS